MKMRFLTVVFLLFCYACVTSGKGNVIFASKNFHNILRWDAASPRIPGETVQYRVFYGVIDNEEFKEKAECQYITEEFCDLTDETPPDHDTYYRAKVVTSDGSLHGISGKFKPIAETVLGAPTLFKYTSKTSLRLDVMLPVGPHNEHIQDIFNKNHKGPSEERIRYTLVITEPLWAVQELKNTSGHFHVSLKNNTKYCGYVVYTPLHELGRPVSEQAHFCATPSGDSWMVLPWLLLSAVVVAAVVLVAVCFAKRYVKDEVKNFKLPLSLESTIHPPQPLPYAQKDPNISKLEMPTESEQTGYAKIQFPPNVWSAGDGGYGHKNTIFVPWKEDSSLDSGGLHGPRSRALDDSGQSSEIYGAVAVNVVSAEENEEDQTDGNKSGQLLSSVDISDKKEAQPLFLQTRKNSEGQLMLSFQVPQTFTATAEELDPCERKPLLSYLIVSSDKGSNFVSLHSLESSECSDSGLDENTLPTPTQDCDLVNQYLPTQLDLTHFSPSVQSPLSSDSITHNSAYQPNWIPFNPDTPTNKLSLDLVRS